MKNFCKDMNKPLRGLWHNAVKKMIVRNIRSSSANFGGNDILVINSEAMNIIVNGGTRGIGKEIAISLAKNQMHRILVTGRNTKSLDTLAGEYSNIQPLTLDLAEFELHQNRLIDAVNQHFKTVDILINTAGSLIAKDFDVITGKEARLMMETNFFGPAAVIRTVLSFLHPGSHIVNISSMGGFQGASKYRGLSYYSASKAAIACLTECLATELSERGIKVNCLAIGAVQTEMFEEAFPGFKAPVSAVEMGEFVADFALNGHKFFNGKILPVAVSNP
jgi:NAD(P)-dependent dehydrogenase (short-subunit alcohol dehydrogenase family)